MCGPRSSFKARIENLRSAHYLLHFSHTRGSPDEPFGGFSEGFFESFPLSLKLWVGLGQDLLRNLTLNRESHLFLSSGPPLAKAWDENLGAKVGGFRFGGALLGALAAKMDEKILALTSLLDFLYESSFRNLIIFFFKLLALTSFLV